MFSCSSLSLWIFSMIQCFLYFYVLNFVSFNLELLIIIIFLLVQLLLYFLVFLQIFCNLFYSGNCKTQFRSTCDLFCLWSALGQLVVQLPIVNPAQAHCLHSLFFVWAARRVLRHGWLFVWAAWLSLASSGWRGRVTYFDYITVTRRWVDVNKFYNTGGNCGTFAWVTLLVAEISLNCKRLGWTIRPHAETLKDYL